MIFEIKRKRRRNQSLVGFYFANQNLFLIFLDYCFRRIFEFVLNYVWILKLIKSNGRFLCVFDIQMSSGI